MCNPSMAKRSHLIKSDKQGCKFLQWLSEKQGGQFPVWEGERVIQFSDTPRSPLSVLVGQMGSIGTQKSASARPPEKASHVAEILKQRQKIWRKKHKTEIIQWFSFPTVSISASLYVITISEINRINIFSVPESCLAVVLSE